MLSAPLAAAEAGTGSGLRTAGAEAAVPRPAIEVRETSRDGGLVEEGTVLSFQFEVANRGEADLVVLQVQSSCGCTVTKWDERIKHGAKGTIQAEMNTQHFRGSVTKHLTVVSNDPARRQVELTISARVIPLVKISPDMGALLVVEDKAVTQEFTMERNGGQPMKIVQVLAYAPYIKAETTPLPGPGRYKLTVTATTDAPMGRSTVPVAVWTDVPKAESMTITLTVERGIATVPPLLFFGILPHEMTTPRQASVLLVRESRSFHVKSIAVHDPRLTPKLETLRDGAEYRVTVTYAGGWDTGEQRQTLTVTTDDPKQPVIEIPVRAAVEAKIGSAPATPPSSGSTVSSTR